MSNALENHELTVISPALPFKTQMSTLLAPEEAMQIDLVPELPPSGGYENIVTAIDVFFPVYLHTRHQIRTPKQLLKS